MFTLIALVALSTTQITAAVLLDTVDGGQNFETRGAVLLVLGLGVIVIRRTCASSRV